MWSEMCRRLYLQTKLTIDLKCRPSSNPFCDCLFIWLESSFLSLAVEPSAALVRDVLSDTQHDPDDEEIDSHHRHPTDNKRITQDGGEFAPWQRIDHALSPSARIA